MILLIWMDVVVVCRCHGHDQVQSKITVSGHNIEVTPAMKEYVEKKLGKVGQWVRAWQTARGRGLEGGEQNRSSQL